MTSSISHCGRVWRVSAATRFVASCARRAGLVGLALGITFATGCGDEHFDGDQRPLRHTAAPAATHWPGFGGPDGHFRLAESGLTERWPESGPAELWSWPLGPGYSQIVVKYDRLYVNFRQGDEDVVQARDVADGAVVWEQRYASPARWGQFTRFGTGPNATPLIHDDLLITLSYAGALHAYDRHDGALLWARQLPDDFGAPPPDFGFSASPIVHDGRLIVLAGGDAQGALALNPSDGAVLWKGSPSTVSYATPVAIDVNGEEQLVYFADDAIIGIDPRNGTRLWDFPVVNQNGNHASSPIWGDDNLLWVPSQLDGGSRVLKPVRQDGQTRVEEVWSTHKMSVHYWNTLRLGDVVFASVGSNGSILAGIDLRDGSFLWRQRGFTKTNILHFGDKALLLDADGLLVLARMNRSGIEVLSRSQVSENATWTSPSLVGHRLYLRDQSTIRAFDLSTGPTPF